MKKVLSSILITVVLLANFLAPVSVGWGDKKIEVGKSEVESATDIKLITETQYNDTEINVTVTALWYGEVKINTFEKAAVVLESEGEKKQIKNVDLYEVSVKDEDGVYAKNGSVIFDNLKPQTTYKITAFATQSEIDFDSLSNELRSLILTTGLSSLNGVEIDRIEGKTQSEPILITTLSNGQTSFEKGEENTTKNYNPESFMPVCIGIGGSLGGCIAQGIYYLIFVPSSFLFALAGTFFDYVFAYSVNDSSYRSVFVVEGWNVVRDFCNMFFIFILLYIAFKTILGLGASKTKEMIINVVIIGLLINFSLFATRVIIDASNILARVFYNSNTIKITAVEKGVDAQKIIAKADETGVLPLSAALVNKVDPQSLIIKAKSVGEIKDSAGQSDETNKNGVTTGTFIIVTLLASAINIVGLIVFLSVGLIFVARVVGLWLAMIVGPFAFFSYTVPAMQDMEMVGWKRWWPETLKLAFLAPVFIFFIYLVLQFLEKGLGIIDATNKTGLDFVVAIVIPFAFIMVLLMKAKDLAKKMSGTMGQSITNGISKVGGFALGAATGGAAMLGRNTLGRFANKISNSGWVNDAAAGKKGTNALSRFAFQSIGQVSKKASSATAKSSFDFRQTKAGNAFTKETGMNLDTGTNFVGLDTKRGLGGYVGVQQRKVEKENKFGESLGYDHHLSETMQDNIDKRKKDISDAERDRDIANAEVKQMEAKHGIGSEQANAAKENYGLAMNKVTALKNGGSYIDPYTLEKQEVKAGLISMEKDLERVKTGRAKEYALTMKRKSGKIYDVDMTEEFVNKKKEQYEKETDPDKKDKAKEEYEHAKHAYENKSDYRDENNNIKKFGHANSDGAQAAKQIIKEFAKGVAQGAAAGAVAGSVIPGIGTLAGAGLGSLAGGIRSTVLNYSGTTNRKVGEESHGDKHEPKNNYNPKTPSEPKDDSHAAPHGADDSHAAPKH